MSTQPTPSKVILVTGATCTGKTTLTHALCPALNATNPSAGPIANPVGQDWFFDYSSFANDTCEMITCGDHIWRNWEASSAVDWPGLVNAVKKAVKSGKQRYVIVEGFLLLENEELVNMCDGIIRVELNPNEIWARRLARALKMKGLPEGMGENRNYEVLSVYASEANLPACEAAIRRTTHTHKYGEHAWMRLYYEEVILPAIATQRKKSPKGKPELVLDGADPGGQEHWTANAVHQAIDFLLHSAELGDGSITPPRPSQAPAQPAPTTEAQPGVPLAVKACRSGGTSGEKQAMIASPMSTTADSPPPPLAAERRPRLCETWTY